MKILCLCKRSPQGRDLFSQPYGRFYYLPYTLSNQGHEVHLLLLNYKYCQPEYRKEGLLHWHSVSIFPWGPFRYLQKAHQLAECIHPDWIIGFSDTWYGIIANRISRAHNIKLLIDAYDNFESYIPWLKPLHWLWRRALIQADAVTAAGPQLAEKMSLSADGRSVAVVPMAADPIFKPFNKVACRYSLGLPLEGTLIGYSGSIHRSRGIDLLFRVFEKLKSTIPDLELVLSGRLEKGIQLPKDTHWLGYRPPIEIPFILNSLDLFLVINKHGAFGDYSYPSKLYEAMACEVPVATVNIPGTAWVLRNHQNLLAQPGNLNELTEIALNILKFEKKIKYQSIHGWDYSTSILEKILI